MSLKSSVSWDDDAYWQSWDKWDERIDWGDEETKPEKVTRAGYVRRRMRWVPDYTLYTIPEEDSDTSSEEPLHVSSYSSAPDPNEEAMAFVPKKSHQSSVSWNNDDYWNSWDKWNETIDWGDEKTEIEKVTSVVELMDLMMGDAGKVQSCKNKLAKGQEEEGGGERDKRAVQLPENSKKVNRQRACDVRCYSSAPVLDGGVMAKHRKQRSRNKHKGSRKQNRAH